MVLDEFRRITREDLFVSYGYGSGLQQIRRAVGTLYVRETRRVFHVPLSDMMMKEIEAAGFRPRQWKYMLPVLSSEIIVRAAA